MEASVNIEGNIIKIILELELHLVKDTGASETTMMPRKKESFEGGPLSVSDGFSQDRVKDAEELSVRADPPLQGDPMNDYVLAAPPSRTRLAASPHSETEVERSKLALLESLCGGKKKINEIAERVGLPPRSAYMRMRRLSTLIRSDGTNDKDHWYSLTADGRDALLALRKKYADAEEPEPSFARAPEPEEQRPISSGVAPAHEADAEPFLPVPRVPVEEQDEGAMILRGVFMQAQLLRRLETPHTRAGVVAEAVKAFEVDENRVVGLLKVMEHGGEIESYGHGRLITTKSGAQKLKALTLELARSTGG
jgi:hypothetical protein